SVFAASRHECARHKRDTRPKRPNVEKLLKQLADIDGKLDALLANADLSADQLAEHDKLLEDRKNVLAAVGRAKASAARTAEREQIEADANTARVAAERARRTVTRPTLTDADAPTPNGSGHG